MPKVVLYNLTKGQTTTKVDLADGVFSNKPDRFTLIKEAYLAALNSSRLNLANTKTRGQVSGSNKKPWRQKGTGRARVGSKRTPLWRGGGIVFGPTGQENYQQKINKQARRQAISSVLSLKQQAKQIMIVDSLALKTISTSQLVKYLKNLKIDLNKKVLMIDDHLDNNLMLSVSNLSSIQVLSTNHLRVNKLVDADQLIISQNALNKLNNLLAKPALKAKSNEVSHE